jgi:hypothetical protein
VTVWEPVADASDAYAFLDSLQVLLWLWAWSVYVYDESGAEEFGGGDARLWQLVTRPWARH